MLATGGRSMTEAEWLACTEPRLLVDWLFFDALASDRKLRLFSVACCEPLRRLVANPGVLAALDLAEAFADGGIDKAAFDVVSRPLWEGYHARHNALGGIESISDEADNAECACLHTSIPDVPRKRDGHSDLYPPVPEVVALIGLIDSTQSSFWRLVRLLHDIFGPLPFRDITIVASWLTSDVQLLARGIYDDKAFDRMPILADALQDAGCDNADILGHCRDTSLMHVRGCWVCDLLLEKG
jgi:hypothetical protein